MSTLIWGLSHLVKGGPPREEQKGEGGKGESILCQSLGEVHYVHFMISLLKLHCRGDTPEEHPRAHFSGQEDGAQKVP